MQFVATRFLQQASLDACYKNYHSATIFTLQYLHLINYSLTFSARFQSFFVLKCNEIVTNLISFQEKHDREFIILSTNRFDDTLNYMLDSGSYVKWIEYL